MDGKSILAQQSVAPLFVWALLLIGLVIGAFVVLLLVRRRTTAGEDFSPQNFTLSDLKRMRDSGELTDEQYQKLREAIIGTAKQAANR